MTPLSQLPQYSQIVAAQIILASNQYLKSKKKLSQEKIAASLTEFMVESYDFYQLEIKTVDQQTYGRMILKLKNGESFDDRLMRATWIWLHLYHSDVVSLSKGDISKNWSLLHPKSEQILNKIQGHFVLVTPYPDMLNGSKAVSTASLLCGVTSDNKAEFMLTTPHFNERSLATYIYRNARGNIFVHDDHVEMHGSYEDGVGKVTILMMNLRTGISLDKIVSSNGLFIAWENGDPPSAIPAFVGRSATINKPRHFPLDWYIQNNNPAYAAIISNLLDRGAVSS